MKVKIIILFSLLISLTACKKAELKKPTTLKTQFAINSDKSNFNRIKFNSAEMTLQNFTITGKRIAGDNINFTRTLETPLNIDFDGITNIDELQFDIPQGDYTELMVNFDAITSTYTGKYKPDNGPTINVVCGLESSYHFSIICEENNQVELIKLDKKIDKTVCVVLNPMNWFETISIAELDNADLISGNNGQGLGNSTILINSTNNTPIYNSILDNISLGNSASFK